MCGPMFFRRGKKIEVWSMGFVKVPRADAGGIYGRGARCWGPHSVLRRCAAVFGLMAPPRPPRDVHVPHTSLRASSSVPLWHCDILRPCVLLYPASLLPPAPCPSPAGIRCGAFGLVRGTRLHSSEIRPRRYRGALLHSGSAGGAVGPFPLVFDQSLEGTRRLFQRPCPSGRRSW